MENSAYGRRMWPGILAFGLTWSGAAQTPQRPPSGQNEPAPQGAFSELNAGAVLAASRAGTLFLDARLNTDFVYGHIPGARNLPFRAKDFESRLQDFLAGPQGRAKVPVVVYCSGCCSTDALMLAQRLHEYGFTRIQVYRDGYPGWARAGYTREVGSSLSPKE